LRLKNRVSIPKEQFEEIETSSIPVRQDLYKELEGFAKNFNLSVEQLTDQLLEKEVTDMQHKEIFSPGLKWGKSFEAHIMARILPQDLPKLAEWTSKKDRLEFVPYENDTGALLIVNSSEAIRREVREASAAELVSS
jgi:hypothetical protein